MEKKVNLTFKNDLEDLKRLHRAVHQFAKSVVLPDKAVFEVDLALDELFTNIVNCAFRDAETHQIAVDFIFENNELMIRIKDDGVPFNPDTVKKPDTVCPLEQRKIGGLGLHLVKKLMDEMQYRREEKHNIIILKKKIRSASSGDSGVPLPVSKEHI